MPETLDGTYEQSLRRIDKQKRDFACRLFQCLVVSKRPLLVEELGELFAIQPDVDTIPTFDARCRPENPEEFVLSTCSTLVAIVKNRGQRIVQFSHFSVREYMTSDRIAISKHVSRFHVLPRPAHALLASACLSVLLQLDGRVVRDEIRNFPLASYAAQYWVDHAQFEDVATEIQDGMERLFDKDKPHFAAWCWLYDNKRYYSRVSQPVPLYYAALFGFRHLAEHIVDAHPQDVNARQGRWHETPLHAAVDKGHLSVAMLLLERGADPNSETNYISVEIPLFLTPKAGTEDMARFLLDHGADPYRRNPLTPLHMAWQRGHIDIVWLLLEYGANPRSPNRGRSSLHFGLQEGHHNDISSILPLNPPDPLSFEPNPAFFMNHLDSFVNFIYLLYFQYCNVRLGVLKPK